MNIEKQENESRAGYIQRLAILHGIKGTKTTGELESELRRRGIEIDE